MIVKKAMMVAATACLAASAVTAAKADPGLVEAESIRKLDIMLMVTSLRCRTTEHDFQAEYRNFSRKNLAHLNRAGAKMRSNLSARYGQRGSKRALDRVSVQMANTYGNGHPWMDCAQLKQTAIQLSAVRDHKELSKAASMLLGPQRVAINTIP